MRRLLERFPNTLKYQPIRDQNDHVIEGCQAYVRRMREGPLPNWPEEVLAEWLFRHSDQTEDYAFLGYDKFQFDLVSWTPDRIPGRAAFRDPSFCDNFQNVEERAQHNSGDWLAQYMMRERTWNSPIVLLESGSIRDEATKQRVKTPYHLLEGHRRLSFLQGLKRLGVAAANHDVWLVHLA